VPTSFLLVEPGATLVPPSWCARCGRDHARPVLPDDTRQETDANCQRWIQPQPLTLTQAARRAATDVVTAVALDPIHSLTTTSPELLDAIAAELHAWALSIRGYRLLEERSA
jgi:hypothetical protein